MKINSASTEASSKTFIYILASIVLITEAPMGVWIKFNNCKILTKMQLSFHHEFYEGL